ncbi:MAG: hypothetical protein IKV49_02850 [Clostridia bacterium]|nr:hypothetical protein [Clostridia bacterium]
MNKNILIRAVSLILVMGVILTAYGCKGGKENSGLAQPEINDNQAVVEFTSVNNDGKEVDATNVIEVNKDAIGNLNAGSTLADTIKDQKDEDKFLDRNEDLGIDKDQAQEIIDNAEKWVKFTYSIYVANTTASRVAFRKLKATNTENIIIDTDLGCEYGFNPGRGMTIYIEGLVNSTKYETEEEIIAELNEMDVDIIYAFVETDLDNVDDWSAVTTAYMPVTF